MNKFYRPSPEARAVLTTRALSMFASLTLDTVEWLDAKRPAPSLFRTFDRIALKCPELVGVIDHCKRQLTIRARLEGRPTRGGFMKRYNWPVEACKAVLAVGDGLELPPRVRHIVEVGASISEGHCNYTNYETFLVASDIDNTRAHQERARQMAAKAIDGAHESPEVADGIWTVEQAERAILADHLKEWIESRAAYGIDIRATMASAALGRVNWDELAEQYITTYRENQVQS
jgi:hypothetical protein